MAGWMTQSCISEDWHFQAAAVTRDLSTNLLLGDCLQDG